ncbi:MAG TPA: M23 family metallopeptidase [Bacteroidales bacterium]|nr:M23 family metallopeptidase [Bacteroidales bacterium]
MVFKRLSVFIFLTLFYITIVCSQKVLPRDYFIPPLDIKPVITGTFGEIRPDHFHSGIDFATQNKINSNVYCVADGYVSRIKVSATGYGNVIYVTHSNGFVSVYAHLNEFNVVVADYIRNKQYEKKSFEIEIFPNPELFKFKKGDIIGYSGNSGSSSGPHLHFEIRNEKTERPLNPLLAGFSVYDKTCPDISGICFYPVSANSKVNQDKQKCYLSTVKKNNIYSLKTIDTLTLSGGIAFGVEAADRHNTAENSGIYSLEIFVDDNLFFKISFDSIDFDEGRYINTLTDYPEYVTSRKKIIQTHLTRGNRLNIYSAVEHRGVYFFTDTLLHNIKFVASDFYKNSTAVNVVVKSEAPQEEKNNADPDLPLFRYGLKNHFEKDNIILDIPADALYDSVFFEYASIKRTRYTYSAIHRIHNKTTPLHKAVVLRIKPDTIVRESLLPKLTLADVTQNAFTFIKSNWENGYLSANVRKFGSYAIIADTTPPVITPPINYNNKQISFTEILSFRITDNFSGIDTYTLIINDKWALAEYDAKNNLLYYKVDKSHFNKGNNTINLVVTDHLNNKSSYNAIMLN